MTLLSVVAVPVLAPLRGTVTPDMAAPFDVLMVPETGLAPDSGTSDTVAAAVAPHDSKAVVDCAAYPVADMLIVSKVVWFSFDDSPVNVADPVAFVVAV